MSKNNLKSQSLADIFFNYGGQTLITVGTGFTAIGVIYAINRITGHGINLLNDLPYLLGIKKYTDSEQEKPITKKDIIDGFTTYCKICGVIMTGTALKFLGNKISSDDTIKAFEKILYNKK